MTRIALVSTAALAAAVVAGCNGGGTTPVATTTPRVAAKPARPGLTAADIRFARTMLAYARQELAAATLASRKGSTAAVRSAGQRLMRERAGELRTLRRLLGDAGVTATAAALPAAERRRSRAYVASLVENAGYRFDDVFVRGEADQHAGDLAAARAELRRGAAPEAKAVARDAIRAHGAEARALGKLGGG